MAIVVTIIENTPVLGIFDVAVTLTGDPTSIDVPIPNPGYNPVAIFIEALTEVGRVSDWVIRNALFIGLVPVPGLVQAQRINGAGTFAPEPQVRLTVIYHGDPRL